MQCADLLYRCLEEVVQQVARFSQGTGADDHRRVHRVQLVLHRDNHTFRLHVLAVNVWAKYVRLLCVAGKELKYVVLCNCITVIFQGIKYLIILLLFIF